VSWNAFAHTNQHDSGSSRSKTDLVQPCYPCLRNNPLPGLAAVTSRWCPRPTTIRDVATVIPDPGVVTTAADAFDTGFVAVDNAFLTDETYGLAPWTLGVRHCGRRLPQPLEARTLFIQMQSIGRNTCAVKYTAPGPETGYLSRNQQHNQRQRPRLERSTCALYFSLLATTGERRAVRAG
jgi:hypothetical protein